MNLPPTNNPVEFMSILWPTARLYQKERDMVMGAKNAVETVIVSCNKAGKDFTVAGIITTFMLAPWLYFPWEYARQIEREGKGHARRIVTTSIAGDHLRVLWAEIGWWLTNATIPLLTIHGGPLYLTDMELRFAAEMHLKKPPSYAVGMVADRPEKLAGHHAPYTLAVGDEASGLDNWVHEQTQGWAKRRVWFGNPNTTDNFFKINYRLGTFENPAPTGTECKFFRVCIQLRATDVPNVAAGIEGKLDDPDYCREHGVPVPGALTYAEYKERLATWDKIRISVGILAEFYEGAELKLVPREWLAAAAAHAGRRPPALPHLTRWLGVDPAEGGDDTTWVVIDRHGVLDVVSLKTADTNVVYGKTLELARRWGVVPVNIAFDRGGGKEHADRLRAQGGEWAAVRTYDFGTIKQEPKRGIRVFPEKKEVVETKGEFKLRRSEMYWNIRQLLSQPLTAEEADGPDVRAAVGALRQLQLPRREQFATPLPLCEELHRQLACVPLRYDELGRFDLIPKQDPRDDPVHPENLLTFRQLLGRSPDVADAFALAVYAMQNKPMRQTAGPT